MKAKRSARTLRRKQTIPKSKILLRSGVSLLAIFISLNIILLLIFNGRTAPNTKLNGISIGNTPIAQLPGIISSSKFLPSKIIFKVGSADYSLPISSLGISLNVGETENNLKSASWLPIANLWTSRSSNLVLQINKPQLAAAISSLASKANVPALGAKIALSGGKFVLVSANNGYSLNQALAITDIASSLSRGKTSITLPTSTLAPNVTDASLDSQLASLTKSISTRITLSYNGKSTSVTSSDIASWYLPSGNSFVLNNTKILSYLSSVGQADGIKVSNLPSALNSIIAALSKNTALTFALQPIANTNCTPNNLSQLVIVSISARHLWVCNGPNLAYDTAVVTGDEQYADTLTPLGTYHIYAKETNRTLTGSDENGSWNDFVNYWMPFLYNQYGAYGFHDATWRDPTAFGNIDPNSSTASNGCVELPLAAAKWIYNWAVVGTTVSIVQ
ncbi:MAG TPA: L,D-transpeptidase family protein [Candidatus Saccharimonadales bacterium]|nr:L,D-transpeptidase family protein [Candidatus Saccharimonadales bacterium]